MTTPRSRRSFSLRTLFVGVTVLGCWLGWQAHIVKERESALSQIANAWGKALLTGQWTHGSFTPESPPLIRALLGDRMISTIWLQPEMTDDLERIRRIFPEAAVEVDDDLPREPAADHLDIPREFYRPGLST